MQRHQQSLLEEGKKKKFLTSVHTINSTEDSTLSPWRIVHWLLIPRTPTLDQSTSFPQSGCWQSGPPLPLPLPAASRYGQQSSKQWVMQVAPTAGGEQHEQSVG